MKRMKHMSLCPNSGPQQNPPANVLPNKLMSGGCWGVEKNRVQVSRRSHRLELAWRGCKFGGSKSNPRNDHNLLPQSLGSQTPKSLMYMERFFLTL